ncbi:protein-export chaperone SecB [Pantoea agglomerans]|uniref:protein-export chaperone SecB n=1 Tax=Enterobacter agglomerans TaxID=549 RepID=UPI00177E05F4|nr:protein-export chaperone SecB [Pantoea agglomerans]MBD8116832.1 protein-export chaperone SecB [Pantoea agglomerans]
MAQNNYKLHATQLKALQVFKLGIEVHDPHVALSDNFELGEFSIENGHTEFNEETKSINVRMRVRAGRFAIDDDNLAEKNDEFLGQALSLIVEVGGVFNIDTEQFPAEHIHDWAEKNAPLVLYPYLREQVYGLSTRVGIKPVLLPLLEVPTMKFVKN